MAKFKFDAKKFERDIKKQLQRQLDQVIRQEYYTKEREQGNMIYLNRMEEDMLKAILSVYDGNDKLVASGKCNIFPEYMRLSINSTFGKLEDASMIARYILSLEGGWSAYLSPDALNYFDEKEKILERKNNMFKKLTPECKTLLDELISIADSNDYIAGDNFPTLALKDEKMRDNRLSMLINAKYLKKDIIGGYTLLPQAYTYTEEEAAYERQHISESNNTTNNFWGNASNVQIQQNVSGSSQSMNVDEPVDFDKAWRIFNDILNNLGSFELSNDEEEQLKNIATEAKSISETKTDGSFVKKSIMLIKDIMLRATGSLTASGILHLISQMGGT